jgi:hypothetical protein
MKKQILTLTGLMLTGLTIFAQETTKINIGLVPPLSSNWRAASRETNSFSLNLIAGVSAAETGFTLAGIANIVHNNTSGFQIAGFSNHVGKAADGALIAGFMNTSGGGNGFEMAGFGNFAKTASGAQIAGFTNFGGNVSTLQVAGFMNVAKNVDGAQITGFINKAKNVRGVQFAGFINIADSANCQVGLVNISKNGEVSIGATVDENRTALLSLRSGGKWLYGIIGLGYNFSNKKDVYAYEAGFGLHVVNLDIFRLNAELTNTSLLDFKGKDYYKSSFALMPAIKLANRIELFAGPSINYLVTNSLEDSERNKKYISSWGGRNGDDFHGFYIGYTAGIAVHL